MEGPSRIYLFLSGCRLEGGSFGAEELETAGLRGGIRSGEEPTAVLGRVVSPPVHPLRLLGKSSRR